MSIKNLKPAPHFKNEAEEQEFQATHESVDFIGTSKPTKIDLSQMKPSAQNTKQVHPKANRVQDTLKKLKGIVGKDHKNASTTIDELLYGENGAWRGIKEQLHHKHSELDWIFPFSRC